MDYHHEVVSEFSRFISDSPSSFHAAAAVQRLLSDAGFSTHRASDPWDATPGGHVVVSDGAVVAWWVPEGIHESLATGTPGFRIIGSHTDSPGFKLKPNPDIQAAGWQQAAVEVYGGPITASWLDREITFAGRVVLADGSERLISTGPVARIPHLAIHLYRSDELKLDRQQHLQPILGPGDSTRPMSEIIAQTAGVEPGDILAHDLISCPTQAPELIGAESDMLAAPRMDNLSSVFASVTALIKAVASGDTRDDQVLMIAAFDHEEVGSNTATGAAGPLLEMALKRTAAALSVAALNATTASEGDVAKDGVAKETWFRMAANSSLISADAAHSVHPNFAGKHDPGHHPIINAGPVTKLNANQRYASTAASVAIWEQACRAAGVPTQSFVSNNDVPCGSTIGPISSTRLGISTVDVGVPLLSMHSARELAGTRDLVWFVEACEAYLVS